MWDSVISHSLTHSLTHLPPLTDSLTATHWLTYHHSLTHLPPLTDSLTATHWLTYHHSLTQSIFTHSEHIHSLTQSRLLYRPITLCLSPPFRISHPHPTLTYRYFFVLILILYLYLCLWSVSNLSLICLWSVSNLSLICLWSVSNLSLICLWSAYFCTMQNSVPSMDSDQGPEKSLLDAADRGRRLLRCFRCLSH